MTMNEAQKSKRKGVASLFKKGDKRETDEEDMKLVQRHINREEEWSVSRRRPYDAKMADRSTHPVEPLAFHPCDTPTGMEYYDLACLTKVQQQRLNNHKIEVLRENQKYLFKNPEIRGVLQAIMRKILVDRPTHDVEQFVGSYFCNNWQSITEEVNKYVEAIGGRPSRLDSRLQLREEKHVTLDTDLLSDEVSDFSYTSSTEDQFIAHLVKDILDELLERVDEQDLQYIRKVQTSDAVEVIEERHKRPSEKSDDEDELIFDLGLDFDLDFSAYHEEDDNIMQSLNADALHEAGSQF